MINPFHFYTQLHLVRLLGLKAKNPGQLLSMLRKVPESSIYYHTHRFLQQHHYLSPEPPNDFAYWLTNVLNLEELGEALASVDVVSFDNMEELRREFTRLLSEHIQKGRRLGNCPPGQEFHFMSCVTLILPTPHLAHNIQEFLEALDKISVSSLYFHIFEARMRLHRDENDFSAWFESIGETSLANEVSRLDPYTITLEGLREKLKGLVKKYA